jgi:hypothetical protein
MEQHKTAKHKGKLTSSDDGNIVRLSLGSKSSSESAYAGDKSRSRRDESTRSYEVGSLIGDKIRRTSACVDIEAKRSECLLSERASDRRCVKAVFWNGTHGSSAQHVIDVGV